MYPNVSSLPMDLDCGAANCLYGALFTGHKLRPVNSFIPG